ncbi:hypothetical protein GGR55DRAFT_699167 [Xylaria sp. FL0064]|nr:hypothetical protein GGR55DRAFT_699167 [Xylaria sp. FL0064]
MDSPKDASIILGRFGTACEHAQLACHFIVSIDICQKDAKIKKAYSGPKFRDWLLNSLETASLALGYDTSSSDDWGDSVWMEHHNGTLHVGLAARREVLIPLPSPAHECETVSVKKGQQITLNKSGKWKEEAVGDICE